MLVRPLSSQRKSNFKFTSFSRKCPRVLLRKKPKRKKLFIRPNWLRIPNKLYHKKLTLHLWNTKGQCKVWYRQFRNKERSSTKDCSKIILFQPNSVISQVCRMLGFSNLNLRVKIPKMKLNNFWHNHVHQKRISLHISRNHNQRFLQWRILFHQEYITQYAKSLTMIFKLQRSTLKKLHFQILEVIWIGR